MYHAALILTRVCGTAACTLVHNCRCTRQAILRPSWGFTPGTTGKRVLFRGVDDSITTVSKCDED